MNFIVEHIIYLIFFLTASIHTLFYTIWRNDIFEWHPDPGLKKRRSLKTKRAILSGEIKNDRPPVAWKIEHYLHVFLGLILGWALLGILFSRLGIFSGKLNLTELGWPDLILFIGGWIGINGRLPTIAHDVQNWFARR